MSTRSAWRLAALLALIVLAGCESSTSSGAAGGPTVEQLTAKQQVPQAKAAPEGSSQVAETASADAENAMAKSESVVPEGATKAGERPPSTVRQGTYLGAVFGADRSMRMAIDDWSWNKSVQLFEAENGRKPRDTQEFMDRIKSEGTRLPDIPEGTKYFYDPNDGQFGKLYAVGIDPPPADAPTEQAQK